MSPNHFGQVKIRLLWTTFYNLDQTKMNWTHPKRLIVNKNYFGIIEGQGITNVYLQHNNKLCNTACIVTRIIRVTMVTMVT